MPRSSETCVSRLQAAVALQEREAQLANEVAKRRVIAEAKRAEDAERKKFQADKAVAAAREGKRKARERLAAQQQDIREQARQLEELRTANFEKRVAAVMQLKSSMDEARRELKAKNTIVQIKRKQRREEEQSRFNDLLEDGQNPYEVSLPLPLGVCPAACQSNAPTCAGRAGFSKGARNGTGRQGEESDQGQQEDERAHHRRAASARGGRVPASAAEKAGNLPCRLPRPLCRPRPRTHRARVGAAAGAQGLHGWIQQGDGGGGPAAPHKGFHAEAHRPGAP